MFEYDHTWWIPDCSTALLLCHTCPPWSAPITLFFFKCHNRIFPDLSSCHSCSFPPHLLSFSGVCSAPGGERRLLQSRFVVSLFCLFLHEDTTSSGPHAFTCSFLPSSSLCVFLLQICFLSKRAVSSSTIHVRDCLNMWRKKFNLSEAPILTPFHFTVPIASLTEWCFKAGLLPFRSRDQKANFHL